MMFVCKSWPSLTGFAALVLFLAASVIVAPLADVLATPVVATPAPDGDDETAIEWKHSRHFVAVGERPSNRAARRTFPTRIALRPANHGMPSCPAPSPFHVTLSRPLHC
jgi:hypothetical protein